VPRRRNSSPINDENSAAAQCYLNHSEYRNKYVTSNVLYDTGVQECYHKYRTGYETNKIVVFLMWENIQ
jgi:hypothetical protein